MKKSVLALLVLIPALGVSSTSLGKVKAGKAIAPRPITVTALVAPQNLKSPSAIRKEDPQDPDKVIMILETRHYMLTIYGGADGLYSVSTQDGVALAEKLDLNDLKVRFPELHELLNGSWACDSPMHF